MKGLIGFLVLIGLATCVSIGSKDGNLDPGRILWPKDTWVSSPIELARTNSGLTTTITFNFRPTTTLTSGYVQIILPSGLTGTLTTTMALTANKDTKTSFSLALPSGAAVYGPFGIVSRTSITGQIVDVNYVFGCIVTTAAETSASTLTVTTSLETSNPVISTQDSLYFAFSLAQSFWRHDLIEIIPDSDWTLFSSTISCSSEDVKDVTNQFYAYDGTKNLPCALATSSSDTTGPQYTSTGSKSIYIYGVDRDVFIASTLSVKIKVSTFTLPGYVKSSSSNSWVVKIWRFGTNNLLAKYAGSGPVGTSAGALTFSSWQPVSGIDKTIVPTGITLFSTVTFTSNHLVKAGGTAVIQFSNADLASDWWQDLQGNNGSGKKCYMSPTVKGASCAISTSDNYQVTITFSNDLSQSTSVSITLLTALTTGAKISSITTYTASSATIDTVSSPYSWPLSSDNKAFGYFKYHSYFAASGVTNMYPATSDYDDGYVYGADTTYDLYWAFYPGTSVIWTAGTTIAAHLSISTSLSYTASYIASDAAAYDLVSSLPSSTEFTEAVSSTRTYLISGNTITASFITAPTASEYFIFAYNGNSALPYVASNLATFYECWAKSSTNEVGNSVFSVLVNDLKETNTYTKPLCLSTTGAIPFITVLAAADIKMDMDFTSTSKDFTLEITITNGADLGTNLSDNSDLPCKGTVDGAKCTISKTNSGADTLITVKGLGLFKAAGTDITLYIAKGILTASTDDKLIPTTSIYYTTSADSSNQNLLLKSAAVTGYDRESEKLLASGDSTKTWSMSETGTLSITTTDVGSGTSTGGYVGVGMPIGFTLNGAGITVDGHSATKSYQATMSDQYSVGGFILGIDDGTFRIASAGSALSVSGIVAPKYAGTSNGDNSIPFNVFAVSTVGATCDAADISSLTNTISVGTISDVSCSSNASTVRGPDSVDSTMTITIALPHGIPKGGSVTLTMDGAWSYSYATCKVSGMDGSCSPSSSPQIIVSSDFSAGTITVTFSHVMPPTSDSSASCISAVYTQDSKNNYIDYGHSFSQTINLSAAADPGVSTLTPTAIPNFPSATGVDLFLSFTLSKALPAGSDMTISAGGAGSWLKSGDIKDYCWSNLVYTSCSVSSSAVTITFQDSITTSNTVQLYLDSALTLPSTTASTGFQITAKWHDTTIISDSTTGTLLTVGSAPAGTISIKSVSISSIDNAGEASDYLFSFTSTQDIATGDSFIIQFPRDFDAYLGDADNTFPDCSPGDWYLPCNSTTLGTNLVCRVDHWYLNVSGIAKTGTTTSSDLGLTVKGIRNPKSGTTGYFNIWQYSSSNVLKAYQNSAISTKTSDPVSNSLTFKNITIDSKVLSSSSNYNFDFYCAGTFTSDYTFEIRFPPQFNFKLTKSGTTTACTTKYYDDSAASNTDPTVPLDWNTSPSCSLDLDTGRITMSVTSGVSKTFTSTNRIRISLTGINNAQWGLSRSDTMWDNVDTAVFGSFSQWTNRFSISAIHNTQTTVFGKSYNILNASYLGFNPPATEVNANSYAPENGSGKIQLIAGTQTQDIPISVSEGWPLKSKKLKMTPSPNPNYGGTDSFEFTSIHNGFLFYQMTKTIRFRISAKLSTSQGLYYMDWTTEEDKQPGVNSNIYSAPLSMLVEVCPPSATITPTVSSIPTLYKGYKSIPIAISLPRSPATDITIGLSTTTSGITFSSSTLTFNKDTDVRFFEISVLSSYTSQSSPTITFSITGTDSAAYSSIGTKTLSVVTLDTAATAALTQPTVKVTQTAITRNTVTLSVSSNQNGVLYWGFSCKGSLIPTFRDMVASTSDPVYPANTTYTYQQLKDMDYNETETDINPDRGDTDIGSFFRRMHARHCATYYANAQVVYADAVNEVILDNLMAGTEYVLTAYVDNRLLVNQTSEFTATTFYFGTSALATASTTTVSFSGTVDMSNSDNIRNVLAKNMGVNPSWLTLVNPPSSSRFLQSTSTFTYNVLYDRAIADYSSDTIVSNLNQDQATSDFSTLYNYQISSYQVSTSTRGDAPMWVATPIPLDVEDTTATFMATSNKAGTVYVSCTDEESELNTYAWQVVDGLNANSNPGYAAYGNWTKNQNTTLVVSDLTQGTVYNCYFTACDDYPVLPACIDYENEKPLVFVQVTTKVSDSGAALLSLLVAFFLLFL